jgi:hypothetical protein
LINPAFTLVKVAMSAGASPFVPAPVGSAAAVEDKDRRPFFPSAEVRENEMQFEYNLLNRNYATDE